MFYIDGKSLPINSPHPKGRSVDAEYETKQGDTAKAADNTNRSLDNNSHTSFINNRCKNPELYIEMHSVQKKIKQI